MPDTSHPLASRFRKYYPVIIDVETGGFDPQKNALLEIAAVLLTMDSSGELIPLRTEHCHIIPDDRTTCDPAALKFNGIDPNHPFRLAVDEKTGLSDIFKVIKTEMKNHHCVRAVLVGHNAQFDLSFVNGACERQNLKRSPFHPFTCFDTASLCGLMYGQTVLAKAMAAAGIEFDLDQAHGAKYDAEKTAEIFCAMVNKLKTLGGWP